MAQFRWHRGSLEESMKERISVLDKEQLFMLLQHNFKHSLQFNQQDITIEYYTYDERIEEHTYLVSINGFGAVGWLDETLMEE